MFRPGMNPNLLRSTLLAGATFLLVGATADGTRYAVPSPPPRMAKPAHGVLFADDFATSASLAAWHADHPSVWTIWRGMLRADLPDEKQMRSLIYTGDTAWADIAVDVDMCMVRGVDKGVVVRVQGESGVAVDLRGGSYQDVLLYQREGSLGRAPAVNANGTWNHLRIEARNAHFRVFVNGELKIDRTDTRNPRRSGRIALPAYTGGVAQCTVYYENLVVTSLD